MGGAGEAPSVGSIAGPNEEQQKVLAGIEVVSERSTQKAEKKAELLPKAEKIRPEWERGKRGQGRKEDVREDTGKGRDEVIPKKRYSSRPAKTRFGG